MSSVNERPTVPGGGRAEMPPDLIGPEGEGPKKEFETAAGESEATRAALELLRAMAKESDAEAESALKEAESVIELGEEDIIPLTEEIESLGKEMHDVANQAAIETIKRDSDGPSPRERMELMVDLLGFEPVEAAKLDAYNFGEAERTIIGLKLARSNPDAFLTASRYGDFGMTRDEQLAVLEEILDADPKLFARGVWDLGVGSDEIARLLAEMPRTKADRGLEALKMPGGEGGREPWSGFTELEAEFLEYTERTDLDLAAAARAERALLIAIQREYPERAEIERGRTETERMLKGKIERVGDISIKSANAPLWIRLEGKATPAVYKPRAREAPIGRSIEVGQYASREWLAYQIDKALQLDLVPPTVMRDGPDGIGAAQDWKFGQDQSQVRWLEWAKRSDSAKAELSKVAFFDVVTNNSDRHCGNWLIAPDGKAHGIDHGAIFAQKDSGWDGVRSWPLWAVEGGQLPAELVGKIEAFRNSKEVRAVLKQAFHAALGDDAERSWDAFIRRIDETMDDGLPLLDDLHKEGNAWVQHDGIHRQHFDAPKQP